MKSMQGMGLPELYMKGDVLCTEVTILLEQW